MIVDTNDDLTAIRIGKGNQGDDDFLAKRFFMFNRL